MTEATWGDDAMTPAIDWRMSASLQDVDRGDTERAEVKNLRAAVRAWQQLDYAHQATAVLTPEHAIENEDASLASFSGAAIATLAEHLRPDDAWDAAGPIAA